MALRKTSLVQVNEQPSEPGLCPQAVSTRTPSAGRWSSGFSLVEMLALLVGIAILASILVPTLRHARKKLQIAATRVDMKNFEAAIMQYHASYQRFPASPAVRKAVNEKVPDFTYGTYYAKEDGTFGIMRGLTVDGKAVDDLPSLGDDTFFRTCNAELVAILSDLEQFRDGSRTVNKDHQLNPQKLKLLNAKSVDGHKPGGVGPDGLYRDAWGMPYIVTIDQNFDGRTRDSFYKRAVVSGNSNSNRPGQPGANRASVTNDTFEIDAPVIIWSLGPDRQVSFTEKGTAGANKDNLLSWK